jgi:hypothetical protein
MLSGGPVPELVGICMLRLERRTIFRSRDGIVAVVMIVRLVVWAVRNVTESYLLHL